MSCDKSTQTPSPPCQAFNHYLSAMGKQYPGKRQLACGCLSSMSQGCVHLKPSFRLLQVNHCVF